MQIGVGMLQMDRDYAILLGAAQGLLVCSLTVICGGILAWILRPLPMENEEAPNPEADLAVLKQKADMGAAYAVTQLFYDNAKYFDFVDRARRAGITIPIIPGIKPFAKLSQLNVVPKTFHCDLPQALALEIGKCKTDEEAKQVGIEWTVEQCRELIGHGVPSIHFYTVSAVDSIREIARQIY